jgi:glycosyltransferase involved in cell wall biosynthesis
MGYRVGAICHDGEVVAPMRERLGAAGVEVHAIIDSAWSWKARGLRLWRLISTLRRYKGGILCSLIGWYPNGATITAAGRLAGLKIVRADLQTVLPPVSLKQRLVMKAKDLPVDRIVVGAAENRDEYVRLLRRDAAKFRVVNTGIDLTRFEPGRGREAVRSELGLAPEHVLIGTVSRLTEETKGVHNFLAAAARVAAEVPEARFVIVGDGLIRSKLEQQARDLEISERVIFTGWRPDVPAVLAALDIFVMCSMYEGGPTTLVEAMAMAKAVISTRAGMGPEVLADGVSGILVGRVDIQGMASAMTVLARDANLRTRMGERAREKALTDLSTDNMVAGYLDVFTEVAARSAPRSSMS